MNNDYLYSMDWTSSQLEDLPDDYEKKSIHLDPIKDITNKAEDILNMEQI